MHVKASLCLCVHMLFLWLFCHFSACLFVLFIFLFYILFLDVCSFSEEKESTVWFSKGRDMDKIWGYLGEVKSQPIYI